MKVVTVLRCSNAYKKKHVIWLHKQLTRVGIHALCLTDAGRINGVDTYPLLFEWPSWWAKMEVFNPDHPVLGSEPVFYLDLDTLPLADFSSWMNPQRFIMLNDFYQEHAGQSGLLNIPVHIKKIIWDIWMGNPQKWVQEYVRFPKLGDGSLLQDIFPDADRFQNLWPNQIISYKAHWLKHREIPKTCKLICFHGQPRPWDVDINALLNR